MEGERRDEFGGVKKSPLRNRLKAFFIRHPRPLLSLHKPRVAEGGGFPEHPGKTQN